MRSLCLASAISALTLLGACSDSTAGASSTSGAGATTTNEVEVSQDTEVPSITGTGGTSAPAEPVAALARGLEKGGVSCTYVTAESAPAELQLDAGICLGPDGAVLQLNVFRSDPAMEAGRALIAEALQDAGITDVDGVVAGRAMVAGDSELLSQALLERIAAAIDGEIVNIAADA